MFRITGVLTYPFSPEPESFAALLSRLNNLRQAQGRRRPQRDSPGPSPPGHKPSPAPTTKSDHQRTPHLVDRSTTVVPARRRFRTSPRAPAPDALGARKPFEPGVDGSLGPDSGILLSRSGRLCTAEGRAVGTLDVDSRAPNSVFSAQVDVDMGMGVVGHWCRDFVGGELMAAERCGWAGGYGRVQPERKLKSTRGVRI